jgi:dTDP-L-rhamnose 4-epimerase
VKVLVTGGAGFIGSHIVDELVDGAADVRVVDILHPAAHRSVPEYINSNADYAWVDLNDDNAMARIVDEMDAVCHQASMVGLGASFGDVTDYVKHNDGGTASLLRAMYRAGFAGRLVLASSMVVYGEGRYRCRHHGLVRPAPRADADLHRALFDPRCPRCGTWLAPHKVTEEAPVHPVNVYGATKLHQEHLCSIYGGATGVPVAALRYHNVYGARMPRDTPYAGVASVFRTRVAAGRSAEVFEDGKQQRDFVHVRDVARANVRCLVNAQAPRGAFNIASSEVHTVGEMAEAIANAAGPGAPRPRVTGRFRVGDARHIIASPARANQVLDWHAEIPFDVGMKQFATSPLR